MESPPSKPKVDLKKEFKWFIPFGDRNGWCNFGREHSGGHGVGGENSNSRSRYHLGITLNFAIGRACVISQHFRCCNCGNIFYQHRFNGRRCFCW